MPAFLEILCDDPLLAALPGRVEAFLDQDIVELVHDGLTARGYRSPDSPCLWLRDHSDMLRAGRWFHGDVTSAVDLFAATRSPVGALFDFITDRDGKENWTRCVRVPVEADVEYRFVKALHLAWQAGGDDDWARSLLPAAGAALTYTMEHPWRWDPELGLVKRACTIDTWDFAWRPGPARGLHFRIDADTLWGIYHCDNSGLHESLLLLADLEERLGDPDRARELTRQAGELRQRANDLLWNGRFYRHRHPLTGGTLPGVDEEAQLSLSNPMAANRGLATPAMARALVDEYLAREERSPAFAGWFSIDPPYPQELFGDPTLVPGSYVNGGIMPLVGGELARAALECGREEAGVAILRKYAAMVEESGATWLWYFPDGSPSTVETSTSPEALPTDGWGSTAMLWALVEGLCGLVDRGRTLDRLHLSPRWVAAGLDRARVRLGYPASGVECGYEYEYDRQADSLTLTVSAPGPVQVHLLVPESLANPRLTVDGEERQCTPVRVDRSPYLDFHLPRSGRAVIRA